MVGKKKRSTMLQSFMAMIIVTLLWVVVGFSLSFGSTIGGFIGDPTDILCFKILIPLGEQFHSCYLHCSKLSLIITPALITGAFAERIRFGPICYSWYYLFFFIHSMCHMTWHVDGYFFKMGVLDFAGGTVVHMSAGWAALAGAMFLGKRKTQKIKSSTYYLCVTELDYYGLVGLASMLGLHLRQMV
jgi:Amt family ammonium transporter